MPENRSGKLADPEWCRQRASRAGSARTTPEYHLTKLREAVAASRAVQGLPPVVVDDLTLAKVADLIAKGAA